MSSTGDEGMKPVNGSLFLDGIFIFEAIVVIVNVKIFIHSSTHTWLSLTLQFGSILMFYIAYGVLSSAFMD